MSESASPESGPLSVADAIASLTPEPAPVEENNTPEAPLEAAEEPDETEAEASPAEEAEEGAETPAEGEEEAAETPEPEKLAAPLYWKPEAKAVFDAMTPEQQAVVLAQEGPREEATAKAKAQAAAETAKAQQELAGVQTLAQQLAEFLPQAVKTFQQRWGEPDWAAVAQEHGAEQAFVLKSQYEAEQKQLSQVAQAEQTARTEAHRAFVQTEWRQLSEIAPELAPDPADPTKGADKRQAVTKYLQDAGIPQDAIVQISAREMMLARKAMLYDEAQAALKAPKPPKPVTAIAQRAAVRPAAAQAQSSSQRSTQQIANRFAQTRSVDDAVALLLARKA